MNRLKELRQEWEYSLEQCSRALEYEQLYITPDQLKKYEDMDVPLLDWKFWQKVADFWDVDLAYLLNLSIFRRQADVQQQLLDYEDFQHEVDEVVEALKRRKNAH